MKKGKSEWRGGRSYRGVILLAASFLMIAAPLVWADEGAKGGNGGGGFFSGVSRSLSNLTSGLPDAFSELSPADVGHKPRIRPHFAFNQGYISNARLGPKQADSAWQARFAPGITVSIPSGKLYTEADYTYGFATTQGRKTHANVSTHNINALARYDLTADTVFGVGDNLQISEVPGESGSLFLLETATAEATHRIGPKLTARLGDTLQYFNDKSKDRQSDFIDNGVSLNMPYDVTNELALGPSFAWNIRHFPKMKGKSYWQIIPGVTASYKLGPKTTVGGNVGWAFRRFDHAQGANDTQSEVVYGASLSHLLGHKLVWSVNYAKTLVDTFDTSFVFRDRPEASTLDNLDRNFRVLKSHRLGSSVTYHFNEKNSATAFGDFQYINANAKDNVIFKSDSDEKQMEIGAMYSYRFNRYISFDVLYAFGRRFDAEANPHNRTRFSYHKATAGVNISI